MANLRQALEYLQPQTADPLFQTKIGKTFRRDQICEAMAYETLLNEDIRRIAFPAEATL
jgi:hypothetical protein